MTTVELRTAVLRAHGAGELETQELLAYNANRFSLPGEFNWESFPLPDEEFATAWETYVAEAPAGGVFDYLKLRLVQLNFRIEEGISLSGNYRAATRRGEPLSAMPEATGLVLCRPEYLRISMHATPAGRIALLLPSGRDDFVSLVRALTMRNEPGPVPASMGACIVAGYNNWDRVHRYQTNWTGTDWAAEFQRLSSRKHLYQDRFILLSDGNYSAAPADAMGLSPEEWRRKSLTIRREHEATHYFTRRVFSSMRNNVLDELIADFCGITAAVGRFPAEWFLRFLGLENFPVYREGGRLENYRGEPPLSGSAFRTLGSLVKSAAESLEFFAGEYPIICDERSRALVISTLSTLTLEELAAPDSAQALANRLEPAIAMRSGVSRP